MGGCVRGVKRPEWAEPGAEGALGCLRMGATGRHRQVTQDFVGHAGRLDFKPWKEVKKSLKKKKKISGASFKVIVLGYDWISLLGHGKMYPTLVCRFVIELYNLVFCSWLFSLWP